MQGRLMCLRVGSARKGLLVSKDEFRLIPLRSTELNYTLTQCIVTNSGTGKGRD